MVSNTSLEERIAAVEAAITELQKQVANPQPTNWLQQITGSFKDEPAFEEVLVLGRAIRQGDESVMEVVGAGSPKSLISTPNIHKPAPPIFKVGKNELD